MSPTTDDRDDPRLRKIAADGMQEAYLVLSDEEIAKGFVRPVRTTYIHDLCGSATTMSRRIAETYARHPTFYSGTYCSFCGNHFPVGPSGQFRWENTSERVGS